MPLWVQALYHKSATTTVSVSTAVSTAASTLVSVSTAAITSTGGEHEHCGDHSPMSVFMESALCAAEGEHACWLSVGPQEK